MHPLGAILAKWAGLTTPELKAPALVELREMQGEKARLVFLFNHGDKPAQVEFAEQLEGPAKSVREIVSGETETAEGRRFRVSTEVPAQAVRIYRIDF